MSHPTLLGHPVRLPLIGAPMFIVSKLELVMAQCKAGIIGAFPSLNARPQSQLSEWLSALDDMRAGENANPWPIAPHAVNLIVHRSNDRLEADLKTVVDHKVPIVITSLGARPEVIQAVHSYGGKIIHDIINIAFAKKALEKGVDGLVAVAAGGGGHAGTTSPFALVSEIREFFDGPLLLAGAIGNGRGVLAARALGADGAYVGSAFIATEEANATPEYKSGIVAGHASDIVYSSYFTGVHGNYLKQSIENAGLDPNDLPKADPTKLNFGSGGESAAKAWKDIWGAGQGIGTVRDIVPAKQLVDHWVQQYDAAKADL